MYFIQFYIALYIPIALCGLDWVAVKELKSSYNIGETISVTIHAHYGNFI